MNLDISALQNELDEIEQKKLEVNERLRVFSEAGRGGFRGGFGGGRPPYPGGHLQRGPYVGDPSAFRGPDEPRTPRERIPSFPQGAPLQGRVSEGRLASRVEGYPGLPPRGSERDPQGALSEPRHSHGSRDGREGGSSYRQPSGFDRGPPPREHQGGGGSVFPLGSRGSGERGERLPPPPERESGEISLLSQERPRRLMSAVVVTGQTLSDQQTEAPGIAKRPRENDADPATRKRNKRMFGALLGTLQKFKEESAASKTNKAEILKAEALKRAEERKRQIAQEARQFERSQFTVKRLTEVNRKRLLNAETECKKLEIEAAVRALHEVSLSNFLKTGAMPPLLWLPKQHCQDTLLLAQQRRLDLSVWQAEEAARLEEAKANARARTQKIVDESRASMAASVAARKAQLAAASKAPAPGRAPGTLSSTVVARGNTPDAHNSSAPPASEGGAEQQEEDEEEYVVDEGLLIEEDLAAGLGEGDGGEGGGEESMEAQPTEPAPLRPTQDEQVDDRFIGQRAGQNEEDEHDADAPQTEATPAEAPEGAGPQEASLGVPENGVENGVEVKEGGSQEME